MGPGGLRIGDVTVLPDQDALYEAAIAAVRDTQASGRARRLDIASLHGHGTRRATRQPDRAPDLRTAMFARVAEGWTLRRLLTVTSVDRLETERSAVERIDAHGGLRVELRGLVLDAVPVLAPLVVASRVAFLASEDERDMGSGEGFAVREPEAVGVVARYFEALWSDPRTVVLRSQTGIDREGFARARAEIEAFTHHQFERRLYDTDPDEVLRGGFGAVLPALDDPRMSGGPRSEFESARRALRSGTPEGRKQAVAEACSAVESGMKVLLDAWDLQRPKHQTAQQLFNALVTGERLSSDTEALILGVSRFGNGRGRHGSGQVPHDVAIEEARAAVSSAAAVLALLAGRLPGLES